MKPTRVSRPPPSRRGPGDVEVPGFPERIALYLYALHRDQAPALLESLAEAPRAAAQMYLEELQGLDSALRQARLTRDFGARPDALQRANELIVNASPPLRRALVRHLPPHLRARFPHLDTPGVPPGPLAMEALAARLVREALRFASGS